MFPETIEEDPTNQLEDQFELIRQKVLLGVIQTGSTDTQNSRKALLENQFEVSSTII